MPVFPAELEPAQALDPRLASMADAATAAFRAVLERHGIQAGAGLAVVETKGRALDVSLTGVDLDRRTRDLAAVRVLSAVRALDHEASSVRIRVATQPPHEQRLAS